MLRLRRWKRRAFGDRAEASGAGQGPHPWDHSLESGDRPRTNDPGTQVVSERQGNVFSPRGDEESPGGTGRLASSEVAAHAVEAVQASEADGGLLRSSFDRACRYVRRGVRRCRISGRARACGRAVRFRSCSGSALVISGEARYDWLHQFRARKSDHGIPRRRRVSLTFRNVLLCGIESSSEVPPAGRRL